VNCRRMLGEVTQPGLSGLIAGKNSIVALIDFSRGDDAQTELVPFSEVTVPVTPERPALLRADVDGDIYLYGRRDNRLDLCKVGQDYK